MEGSPPVSEEVRLRLRQTTSATVGAAGGAGPRGGGDEDRGEDCERETPPRAAMHCVNAGAGNGCGEERRRGR